MLQRDFSRSLSVLPDVPLVGCYPKIKEVVSPVPMKVQRLFLETLHEKGNCRQLTVLRMLSSTTLMRSTELCHHPGKDYYRYLSLSD